MPGNSVYITIGKDDDHRDCVKNLKTLANMKGELEKKSKVFKDKKSADFKNMIDSKIVSKVLQAIQATTTASDLADAERKVAEYEAAILALIDDVNNVFDNADDLFRDNTESDLSRYRGALENVKDRHLKNLEKGNWLYYIDTPDPRLNQEGLDNAVKDSLTLYYTRSSTYIEDRSLVESFHEFLSNVHDGRASNVTEQLGSPAMSDLVLSQLPSFVPGDANKWSNLLPKVIRQFNAYNVGEVMDGVLQDLENIANELLEVNGTMVRQYINSERLTKGIQTFEKYRSNPYFERLLVLIQDIRKATAFNTLRVQTALKTTTATENDVRLWLAGRTDMYDGLRAVLFDKDKLITKALILGFQQPAGITSYKDIKGLPDELYPIIKNLCRAVDTKDTQLISTYDNLIASLIKKQEEAIRKNRYKANDNLYRLPLNEMRILSRSVGGVVSEGNQQVDTVETGVDGLVDAVAVAPDQDTFCSKNLLNIEQLVKSMLGNNQGHARAILKRLRELNKVDIQTIKECIEDVIKKIKQEVDALVKARIAEAAAARRSGDGARGSDEPASAAGPAPPPRPDAPVAPPPPQPAAGQAPAEPAAATLGRSISGGATDNQQLKQKALQTVKDWFGISATDLSDAITKLQELKAKAPIVQYLINVLVWINTGDLSTTLPKVPPNVLSIDPVAFLIEDAIPDKYEDVSTTWPAGTYTSINQYKSRSVNLPGSLASVELIDAWTRTLADPSSSSAAVFMFHIRLPSGLYVAFDSAKGFLGVPWVDPDDVAPYTFYFQDGAAMQYAPVSLQEAIRSKVRFHLRCLDANCGARHVVYGNGGPACFSLAPDTDSTGCSFEFSNGKFVPVRTSVTAAGRNDKEFVMHRPLEDRLLALDASDSDHTVRGALLNNPLFSTPLTFAKNRMCLQVSGRNADTVTLRDDLYLQHTGKLILWWRGFFIASQYDDLALAMKIKDDMLQKPTAHTKELDVLALINKSSNSADVGVDTSDQPVLANHTYHLLRRDLLQYLAFDKASKVSYWTPFRNYAADIIIADPSDGQPPDIKTTNYGNRFILKVNLDGGIYYVRQDPHGRYLVDALGGLQAASVFKPLPPETNVQKDKTKVAWTQAFKLDHVSTQPLPGPTPFDQTQPDAAVKASAWQAMPVFPNGDRVYMAHDNVIEILGYYNMLPEAGGRRAIEIRSQTKTSAKAVGSPASLQSIAPKELALSFNTVGGPSPPVDAPAPAPAPTLHSIDTSYKMRPSLVGRKASSWLTSRMIKGPQKVVAAGSAKAGQFTDSMAIVEQDDQSFVEEAIAYTLRSLQQVSGEGQADYSEQARAHVFALFDTINDTAKRYFRRHLRFATQEFRQFLRYRSRFPAAASQYNGQIGGGLGRELDASAFAEFDAQVAGLSKRANKHLLQIKDTLEQRFAPGQYAGFFEAFPPDAEEVGDMRIEVYDRIDKMVDKIYKMYSNSLGLMDVVLDDQFVAMYVIKGLRLAFVFGALSIVQRIFEQMYIKDVYTENNTPPSLYKMILMFIGVELMFNIMLAILLGFVYLLSIKLPGFVVDAQLIQKYAVDYALTTLLVALVGAVIARVVTRKKYFKYKVEGLRAIRAFRDILFYVAAVVLLIPFFMLF